MWKLSDNDILGGLCDLASCHLNSWIGSFPLIIIFCKTFTPYILISLPGELVKLSWWQHGEEEKGKICNLSNKKVIQVWDMIFFYTFQFVTVPFPTRAPNVLVIFPYLLLILLPGLAFMLSGTHTFNTSEKETNKHICLNILDDDEKASWDYFKAARCENSREANVSANLGEIFNIKCGMLRTPTYTRCLF